MVKFYDKSNANAPLEDIMEEFKLLKSLDIIKSAALTKGFS